MSDGKVDLLFINSQVLIFKNEGGEFNVFCSNNAKAMKCNINLIKLNKDSFMKVV